MSSRCSVLLLCGLCLGSGGCRQALGLEDAEVDPSLSHSSKGGSAGSNTATGGSADAAASGGTSADAHGGAGGASDGLCEHYCTIVIQNCTGAFAVYTSLASCLAVCAALPEGMPEDRNGNTVQCRLHAASVATDEVPHYCPVAGPGGNGVCGSNCESLCQLRDKLCANYETGDRAACLQDCAKLQDLGTYSTDVSAKQYGGPHVQCRLYHLSAAAADDPQLHCKHVDGATPCK